MKTFEKVKQFYNKPMDRILVIGIPVLLFLIGLNSIAPRFSNSAANPEIALPEPDTLIPAGFVLIPVQLENHQSLDSIVGSQAIVNIYLVKEDRSEKGHLVGRNLRMVRAPLNPQQFAVLVPEDKVDRFVTSVGRLHAVLQNRQNQDGTEMAISKTRKTIQFY